MSEPNRSVLHKLADTLAGERKMPEPETVDHVRAAVDAFVNQKATLERQAARIHELEVINGRLDVELETRIQDLNECRRERDHYYEYSVRLVTQLNAADQMIRDALDMAKEKRIEPALNSDRQLGFANDLNEAKAAHLAVVTEPLPPMPANPFEPESAPRSSND